MMNLSLGDAMFVSIKNYICKNFVCRMCVRWWVYVSETTVRIIIIIINKKFISEQICTLNYKSIKNC